MKNLATFWATILTIILVACQNQTATQTGMGLQVDPSQITPLPSDDLATRTLKQKSLTGCTVVSPRPTPGPTEQSIFPPITDKDWIEGSDSAYVTIIEYSDFQ